SVDSLIREAWADGSIIEARRETMAIELRSYVGGDWREGARWSEDLNPARPGEAVAKVSLGDAALANPAIEAARAAFPAWRPPPPDQPGRPTPRGGGPGRGGAPPPGAGGSSGEGPPPGGSSAQTAGGAPGRGGRKSPPRGGSARPAAPSRSCATMPARRSSP